MKFKNPFKKWIGINICEQQPFIKPITDLVKTFLELF